MGFSRQEYWSGLPFPSPRDLPDPGTEPRSPALQVDALTSEPPLLLWRSEETWEEGKWTLRTKVVGEAGEVGQPSVPGGIRMCLDGVWGGESGMRLLTPSCRGEVLSRGEIVDSGQQG